MHEYDTTGGNKRILILVFTGAFNDVLVQTSRQIKLLRLVGDVRAFRYPKKRYSRIKTLLVAYRYALSMRHKYDTVILDGWSIGGGTALAFHALMRSTVRSGAGVCSDQEARQYNPLLQALLSDTPLGGHRLQLLMKAPWVRWIVMHWHVGPLQNLLSAPIMHMAFKKMQISDDDRVDENQLTLHMEAMWRLTLSALIEQVKAIIELQEFEPITDMDAVYFNCEYDEVIDGPASLVDMCLLFGRRLLGVMSVKGGHTQAVERHKWWRQARVKALKLLGYIVE